MKSRLSAGSWGQGWGAHLRDGMVLFLALGAAVCAAAPVDGLIVKFKEAPVHERVKTLSATEQAAAAHRTQRVLQAARMTEARTRPAGRDAQHLSFGRPLAPAEAQALAERLRSQADVEWVELNTRERLLQAAGVPNDLYFPFVSANDPGQWWLRMPGETAGGLPASWGAPGIQGAWGLERGRASAVVAVLDTGITPHSELDSRVLPGYDFVSEVAYANDGDGRDADESDPGDWVSAQDIANNPNVFGLCLEQESSWHGTVISGIVAAETNNSDGVAGINWNGRVLPVRVAGKCGATVLDITDGMRWAAGLTVAGAPVNTNPARIINISFGGDAACGTLYQRTINELAAIGVVVVAAAGNESGAVTRPASCSGVVGVAALARDGIKASYSNFGPSVVISTVGGESGVDDGILTVFNTGTTVPGTETYARLYGTSFAAPIVSGTISLMRSANPGLSVAQVIQGLRSTAQPHVPATNLQACSASNTGACVCTTTTCGAGVLDAEAAVRYAQGPLITNGGGDSGGGALGGVWLLGLAMGVAAIARLSRPGGRGAQRKRLAE